MAIPKTGSRQITVDGRGYRWLVRKRSTYRQANGWAPLSLAISSANSHGSTLVVTLTTNRPDAWIDAQDSAVTPRDVAEMIRRALTLGWKPEAPGKQFKVSCRAGEVRSE